jgi:hypothetical protein
MVEVENRQSIAAVEVAVLIGDNHVCFYHRTGAAEKTTEAEAHGYISKSGFLDTNTLIGGMILRGCERRCKNPINSAV